MRPGENSLKHDIFLAAASGDVFFSRSRTFRSWVIRFVTRSPFSHVFVKVNDRAVIEADVGGVKIRPAARYLDDELTSIELVKLPACVDPDVFIAELNQRAGSFYDYGILAGGLLSKLLKLSRWRENLLNGVSRYTCSELVAESLKAAGMQFKLPTSQITPKDLYYSLKNRDEAN